MRIFYPTTQCEDFNIFRVPTATADSIPAYVKVGCRRCDICYEEIAQQKAKKWRSRLLEMMRYYDLQGHRVLFATLTVHDKDYPTHHELKDRLSKMFNAYRERLRRRGDAGKIKYWAVLEYGEKSGRIHAHIFFFVDRDIDWSPEWSWMTAYWEERYIAWKHDCSLVRSTSAASYATKYGSKNIGHNRDRIMSSQFGWAKFMEERRKAWLGIEKDQEGVCEWLAIIRPDPDAVKRLVHEIRSTGLSVGTVRRAKDKLKGMFKVVGRIEVDKPVLHPFKACPYIISEEVLSICEASDDETGVWTLPASLMYLPASVKWASLIRSELVKLWLAVEREVIS